MPGVLIVYYSRERETFAIFITVSMNVSDTIIRIGIKIAWQNSKSPIILQEII